MKVVHESGNLWPSVENEVDTARLSVDFGCSLQLTVAMEIFAIYQWFPAGEPRGRGESAW